MDDLLKKMKQRYEADRRAEQEILEKEQNRERMLKELDKTNFEIEENEENKVGCGTLIIVAVGVAIVGSLFDFSEATMKVIMFITLGVLAVGYLAYNSRKSRLEGRKKELERELLD